MDYSSALLYGIPAGIIAAVIWAILTVITGWEFGFVAIGIGYLVGYAVYYGAGKKGDQKLQFLSAGISLIAIFIGEYLITNHYLYTSLIDQGMNTLYFLKVWPVIKETVYYVIDFPITFLFWTIALYAGYAMARKRE